MKTLATVFLTTLASSVSTMAWAGRPPVGVSSIPTLDEIGLGALIALVAGVAGWAVRRRSRK